MVNSSRRYIGDIRRQFHPEAISLLRSAMQALQAWQAENASQVLDTEGRDGIQVGCRNLSLNGPSSEELTSARSEENWRQHVGASKRC